MIRECSPRHANLPVAYSDALDSLALALLGDGGNSAGNDLRNERGLIFRQSS
jgi:hypothetical protein